MDTVQETMVHHVESSGMQATAYRLRSLTSQAIRFQLHFLEMIIAMGVGMAVFHLLESQIPDSSNLSAILARGTLLHTLVMDFFMTVPMVAWMIVRGHGWRHSLEMAVAMLAPMATVILLCRMGADKMLPWLPEASSPAMFLGMLVMMIYRRQHYTGKKVRHDHN